MDSIPIQCPPQSDLKAYGAGMHILGGANVHTKATGSIPIPQMSGEGICARGRYLLSVCMYGLFPYTFPLHYYILDIWSIVSHQCLP